MHCLVCILYEEHSISFVASKYRKREMRSLLSFLNQSRSFFIWNTVIRTDICKLYGVFAAKFSKNGSRRYCCKLQVISAGEGHCSQSVIVTQDNNRYCSFAFYYPSWKGDIVFSLSVCPGRSFSHFVRVTPPTVFITHNQTYTIWKLGVWSVSWVFSYPPKFRRIRSLKTAQNHKFQFLERQKSKSFRPRDAIPIPYESLASVV